MRITFDVHVVVNATFHGMTLDIPDDVDPKDEGAVLKWCKANIGLVNYTMPVHSETLDVLQVTGVSL